MIDTNNNMILTTVDNPYSPIKEWDEWYRFDQEKEYNTCELLDRTETMLKEEFPELTDYEIHMKAIDSICRLNISGVHVKKNIDFKPPGEGL